MLGRESLCESEREMDRDRQIDKARQSDIEMVRMRMGDRRRKSDMDGEDQTICQYGKG